REQHGGQAGKDADDDRERQEQLVFAKANALRDRADSRRCHLSGAPCKRPASAIARSRTGRMADSSAPALIAAVRLRSASLLSPNANAARPAPSNAAGFVASRSTAAENRSSARF